jgi:hypothetical protein
MSIRNRNHRDIKMKSGSGSDEEAGDYTNSEIDTNIDAELYHILCVLKNMSTAAAKVLSGRVSALTEELDIESENTVVEKHWLLKLEHELVGDIACWMKSYDLTDSIADENGLFDGLIIPADQSRFLWYVSWTSLPSGLYAMYRGYYDLAAVPLGVLLTSLNYWHYPNYSWRRNLDMSVVFFGMSWQIYRALDAEFAIMYYVVLSIALLCYALSCRVITKSIWLSTIFHAFLHIFGNISNIILYSGSIKPIVYDVST